MNPQLQKYIADARKAGKPDDVIKNELRGAGWKEEDLTHAFPSTAVPPAFSPPAKSHTGLIVGIIVVVVLLMAGQFAVSLFAGRFGALPSYPDQNSSVPQEYGASSETGIPLLNKETFQGKTCSWDTITKVTSQATLGSNKTQTYYIQGSDVYLTEDRTGTPVPFANLTLCGRVTLDYFNLYKLGTPGATTDGRWFAPSEENKVIRASIVAEGGKTYFIHENQDQWSTYVAYRVDKIDLDSGFVVYSASGGIPVAEFRTSASAEELIQKYPAEINKTTYTYE